MFNFILSTTKIDKICSFEPLKTPQKRTFAFSFERLAAQNTQLDIIFVLNGCVCSPEERRRANGPPVKAERMQRG